MMQNRWMDRVSEFVDGELDPTERALFEGRMAEDEELRRAVLEIEWLVGGAASLGAIEPPRDLWPAIQAGITTVSGATVPNRRPGSPAPRPRAWRRAAVIAAGLALMVVSASAGWWLRDFGEPLPQTVASIDQPVAPRPEADMAAANFADQEERLAESIGELEAALQQYGEHLDPDTREAILHNLELIDSAIADAHLALEEDPNSDYLHSHIATSMERKVRLLEDATRLASMEI
jgi:anti-sigma-K factor RskA